MLESRLGARTTAVIVRSPYWMLLGLCCAALIGLLTYVSSSLYALAAGWALPTTALIRFSSLARWAARNEVDFGYVLMLCAGFGAVATWLAINSGVRKVLKTDELMLRRIFLWCGFPIAACAFVFSISAMWSGILRPGDFHSFSIGGLIPHNDAMVYVAAAHDQARDGNWNAVASNRPLAAAFRSVIMFFAGNSFHASLILQSCLLAGATCFASYAVAMWRGIWAAVAFFGLNYIYLRTFMPTALTESLGLFWALLSIPFFIEAWRSRSVTPALIAFAMTVVALMTRMGSMFTIPALLLWLVWQFGQGAAAKFRIAVISICILLGVFGLNFLLQKAYGAAGSVAEGNFAMLICGLAMGTTHHGCVEKVFPGGVWQLDDVGFSAQLYALAWENFRANPGALFERLANGAGAFFSSFGRVTWQGYPGITELDWLWSGSLTAILSIGLLYLAARRVGRVELSFWLLLWASVILSASFVYLEDGNRVMAAGQPLIRLFLAMGFTSPALAARDDDRSPSRLAPCGAGILLVAATLFICVPWLAHRFSPLQAPAEEQGAGTSDQAFVSGGRRMSGFLVVDNGQPLRSDVPTLHLADFKALSRRAGIDILTSNPVTPALPFGLVYAPRLEKGVASYAMFVVPAGVIERREVPAWHFQLMQWRNVGFYVAKAEPYQGPHR